MDLLKLAIADIDNELKTTRRVLERVPDDRLDWTPHAKSMSLGALARHIPDVVGILVPLLQIDEVDLATRTPQEAAPGAAGLVELFDRNAAALREALTAFTLEQCTEKFTLRVGDHVIFTLPRLVALRTFGMGHVGHHRGQLTVYLRLLDVPVPSVYGPTADERA